MLKRCRPSTAHGCTFSIHGDSGGCLSVTAATVEVEEARRWETTEDVSSCWPIDAPRWSAGPRLPPTWLVFLAENAQEYSDRGSTYLFPK